MKKYFVILFGIVLVIFNGYASEGAKYTLKECIEFAVDRNVNVVNAREDQAIAQTQVIQARSTALPHLGAYGSYTRTEDDIYTTKYDSYLVNLSASQVLFSGGKVVSALQAAKESKVYYDYNFEAAVSEVTKDVVKGFYDVLYSKAVVKVREESLEQLLDLLKDSKDRLAAGTASEFDVLRAKVSVSNARPLLISASNNYNIAVASFKRILNMDDEDIELQGGLLTYPTIDESLNDLYMICLLNRADILKMESLLALKEYDKNAAQSDWWPSISLQFNYNGANDDDGFLGEEWYWYWDAGIVASWDIWNGNLTYGRVKEKSIEVRKQEQQYEDFKKTAKLQVKTSFLQMTAALEAIDSAKDGLELAVESQNISSQRYKVGLGTYLEFTDANLSLSTARLTLLTAIHEYMNAIAELEYAVGVELFRK